VFIKDTSLVQLIASDLVKIILINIHKFPERKNKLLTSGEKEKSVLEEQHLTNSKMQLLNVTKLLKLNVKDSALKKNTKGTYTQHCPLS
jgi:hypothetical protein